MNMLRNAILGERTRRSTFPHQLQTMDHTVANFRTFPDHNDDICRTHVYNAAQVIRFPEIGKNRQQFEMRAAMLGTLTRAGA